MSGEETMIQHSIFSSGMEVMLTSADIHSAVRKMAELGIDTRNISIEDPFNIRFSIPRSAYPPLLAYCRQCGNTVRILRRYGLRHILLRMRHRPVLIMGIIGICLLSLLTPSRVMFIRVEGNTAVPTRLILEHAAQCGIRFGAVRRQIRSDTVKIALLASIPQLEWAGINTYGSTAVITVREETVPENTNTQKDMMYIVALRDAIIRQMTVLEGNPQAALGESVVQGQVLVSPYTDCGICIRVTNTKAEIYGETQRKLTLIYPTEYRQRTMITGRKKKYSLIIGKKRINFYKGSGISGSTCAKIYEENYMILPGGYVLPIGMICEEQVEYQHQPIQNDIPQILLEKLSEEYLLGTMLAGNIQQADHVFSDGLQSCRLDSVFRCYELISISHPEEGITENE